MSKKHMKTNIQQPINSWVILLKCETFEHIKDVESGTQDIVTLRHPNTGDGAIFLFSRANNLIQEILTFSKEKRSWLINDSVQTDGKLYFSTPIDPLFLVLPYLKEHCASRAVPLKQFLHDEKFPELERLVKFGGLDLHMITDRGGDEELNAVKYNEQKTLLWLKKKIERVACVLQQRNIHVTVGGEVCSATFIKSSNNALDNNMYLRYAHGIISEYLTEDLSKKLLEYLNLPEDIQSTKRKSFVMAGHDAKRVKTEASKTKTSSTVNKGEATTVKTKSRNEKARSKAASSSKSIHTFFNKI